MSRSNAICISLVGLMLVGCATVLAQEPASPQTPPPPQPVPAQPANPAAPPEQPTVPSNAKIEVSPTEFSFGTVWEGAPAEGTFKIKNVGTDPLTIDAKSSCGCTVPSKPKSPLAPGEETTFTISYSTKHVGAASKTVWLETNDSAHKRFEIPVKGEVKAMFTMTPPGSQVNFPELETDAAETQTVKLHNEFSEPVHLKLNAQPNYGHFDVELKEIKDGYDYELVVKTKPPLEAGRNYATVILDTGLAVAPSVTVRVMANVPPRAAVKPATLLVTPAMDQPIKRVLRVEYRKDQPLTVTAVKLDDQALEYEILPAQPNAVPENGKTAVHQVQVTIPGYPNLPDRNARLAIMTDDKDPAYQKLEVPIIKRAPMQATNVKGRGQAEPLVRPSAVATPEQMRVEPGAAPAATPTAGPVGTPPANIDAETLKKQIEDAIKQAQEKKAAEAKAKEGNAAAGGTTGQGQTDQKAKEGDQGAAKPADGQTDKK